jgi:SAM-dependent methyltransferase
MALEIRESFASLSEWLSWSEAVPLLRDADYIDDVARSVRSSGFIDPTTGLVPAREVVVDGRNYREGLRARGCTARQRALEVLILEYLLTNGWSATIYLAEYVSDFARKMRELVPFLYSSEYMPNPVMRARFGHVTHEDPLKLTLPDHSIDVYISPDNMVYAPSFEGLMKEARRVLRRGGQFLATFPFRYGEPTTEVVAEHAKGETVYHAPPAFHVDPLSGTRSRLVYFVPGWDVLDIARLSGFQAAEVVAMSSRTHAILGTEIATIFVLRATA